MIVGAAAAPADEVNLLTIAVAAGGACRRHPAARGVEGGEDDAGLGADAAWQALVAFARGAGESTTSVDTPGQRAADARAGGGSSERAERGLRASAEEAAAGCLAG